MLLVCTYTPCICSIIIHCTHVQLNVVSSGGCPCLPCAVFMYCMYIYSGIFLAHWTNFNREMSIIQRLLSTQMWYLRQTTVSCL